MSRKSENFDLKWIIPLSSLGNVPPLPLQSRNMYLIVALGGKTSVINSINLSANKSDFEQGWKGIPLLTLVPLLLSRDATRFFCQEALRFLVTKLTFCSIALDFR